MCDGIDTILGQFGDIRLDRLNPDIPRHAIT